MQKLKTNVMKKTVNPVWNEDLTLAVMDASAPIMLVSIIHPFILIPLMIDMQSWILNAASRRLNSNLIQYVPSPSSSRRSCLISEMKTNKKKQLYIQEVFDKDTFSKDDRMGDAEFDIEALVQIIQMDLEDIRSGTVVRTVRPGGKDSCLADESHIIWENGHAVQDILLKLRNVDTGLVHLQLKWVTIPGMYVVN